MAAAGEFGGDARAGIAGRADDGDFHEVSFAIAGCGIQW
jgi:hypothetical protein